MEKRSILPLPSFIKLQYPDFPPLGGIILSSGLIRKIGIKSVKRIINELDRRVLRFEEAEEAYLIVLETVDNDQIWLVKSFEDEKSVLTLMLSSEF